MKFGKLLKELKMGKPQNVGNMAVIPLISEGECTEVSEDMLFNISNDSDYSHLTLRNTENKPVIVPQGTAYLTKQKAQDRAILSTEVIGPEEDKEVDVSCVQSSQSGNMEPGTDDYTFIPATIRVAALGAKTNDEDHKYDVLWKDIEEYVKKIGIGDRAHIHDFYDNFQKELEEFASSFEPVEKQLGAIILINTQVVGIELYPNYNSWKKVWRKLLRDCYGADALALIRKKTAAGFKPIINIDKINSIDDLQEEANKVILKGIQFIKDKLNPVLEEELVETNKNEVGDFSIVDITIGDLKGQIVKKEPSGVIYLTAIRGLV